MVKPFKDALATVCGNFFASTLLDTIRAGGSVVLSDYKVLPDAVLHCAWQMTHRHVRSDRKKQIERIRGVEVDHFRDAQRAAGTSKLYDEWSLRLWMEQILVSDGHHGVHQREFAGVDPSGNAQKTWDWLRES